jgi:hypothetical protein
MQHGVKQVTTGRHYFFLSGRNNGDGLQFPPSRATALRPRIHSALILAADEDAAGYASCSCRGGELPRGTGMNLPRGGPPGAVVRRGFLPCPRPVRQGHPRLLRACADARRAQPGGLPVDTRRTTSWSGSPSSSFFWFRSVSGAAVHTPLVRRGGCPPPAVSGSTVSSFADQPYRRLFYKSTVGSITCNREHD